MEASRSGTLAIGTAEKPWSPLAIFLVGFLFGPIGGGIVTGMNYRRYGQPERTLPL